MSIQGTPIRWAGALALLVITSASAQPLDTTPTAQLRYEMKFGAPDATANARALRFAAGLMRTATDDAATIAERQAQAASTAPLISLFDTAYSFGSQQSDFRVAGFNLTKPDANPALDAAGERSWWSNNWGWVVVAGIAAVTIIAVTAIHDGTSEDNRYGTTNDPGTTNGGGNVPPGSCPANCTCVGVSSICH
jgi:hypothetical protein